jgi:hypothetical protein
MMVAFGTDGLIFLKFAQEDHRFTPFAFVPERFGSLALGYEGNGVTDAGDPIHVQTFLAATMACFKDAT